MKFPAKMARLALSTTLSALFCLPAAWAAAEFADAAASGDRRSLTLTTTLGVAAEDAALPLRVYMIAIVPRADGDDLYARTATGWMRVGTGTAPELLAATGQAASGELPIIENLDMSELGGTAVYVGYGLEGTGTGSAFDEMLQSRRYRLIHTVDTGWQDTGAPGTSALTPLNAAELTRYFRKALTADSRNYTYAYPMLTVMDTVTTAATSGTGTAANFSTTNLQETGVDEADTIKTDGSYLFSFDPAENNWARRERLRRQRLVDTAANAALAQVDTLTVPFSSDVGGKSLYLDEARQQIIAIGEGGYGSSMIYDMWCSPWFWTNGVTEALLIDTQDAAAMQVRRSLRMTGQMIGSRRVGDTLYFVLRSYPSIPGVNPFWPTETQTSNESVVNQIQATDALPTISIDGGAAQPLVDAGSCLIQQDNATASADIITLVGIDLSSSEHRHAARCFTGGTEAFYMSEQSLYLATTRYNYTYNGSGTFPIYNGQVSTDLHKFSLSGLDILYRGSGNVDGHLGYDQNRKSFRMGEHQGYLRIITETDNNFGGWGMPTTNADGTTSSPGRLTILQENAGALTVAGSIPNAARPEPLGKAGERLYASRFLGERAYLVTYRLTDPLYVIDLADPTDPKVAGALEVSGYSDYLFPLDGNLLLGVGKDAVSDGTSGDGRFAWYQGVKVSLIDVADPANPREAARAIIGRRGTSASVLYDHHGIALQTIGRTVRIGLPVGLHESTPYYPTGTPTSDYYSFTRNELDRFEINLDTQTLETLSPIPAAASSQEDGYANQDRALLWNDQVHYYQNGNWVSSPW